MIAYVMVGTNNLSKSITFYDALLDLLSLKRVDTTDDYAGYASKNNPENIEFYIKSRTSIRNPARSYYIPVQD